MKVADNKADLTDGSFFAPINLTETGAYYGNDGIWSGTTDGGMKTSDHCNNWTVGTGPTIGTYGLAGTAGAYWSDISPANCGSSFFLRCFED